MKAFVLHSHHAGERRATAASFAAAVPGLEVRLLDEDTGAALGRELQAYGEPCFLLLKPGDLAGAAFGTELEAWTASLLPQEAGVIARHAEAGGCQPAAVKAEPPPVPLLWRTEAVKQEGTVLFAGRDRLPFDAYVLHEAMYRLEERWLWAERVTEAWRPASRSRPRWQNGAEEWALTFPLIQPVRAPKLQLRSGDALEEVLRFTVLVCTYNAAEYILWALHSVLSQTWPSWELIVVDDGSTDGTLEKVQAWSADPRLRVIRHEANRGKTYSLNRGLLAARGSWVVELDADDWLAPHALETLALAAEAQPKSTVVLHADYYNWTERAGGQLVLQGRFRSRSEFSADVLIRTGMPLAPRCYRTASLRERGGWVNEAPEEGRYYEDFTLLLCLQEQGDIVHVKEPLYHRRIREGSITHRYPHKYAAWMEWVTGYLRTRGSPGGRR